MDTKGGKRMQFEVEAMVRVGKQPWRTPTMRFPQEPACEAKWNPPRLLEFSTFNLGTA